MTLRRSGVLWTLIAGSFLLNVGCTGLNTGVLNPNSQLKENQSSLIGNNSAALIGNNSAALIGNNAASLADKSLASLDATVVDAEGARMSKLIGNNAASLIGNNSASLIGNNSASLIGNNAASFKIATFLPAPVLSWTDSGTWPSPLTSGITVTGVRSGSIASKGEVERYTYSHELQEYEPTGSTMERYHRVEQVVKSLGRRLGEYVFDAYLNKTDGSPDRGFYVFKQTFTPSGGVPLELNTKRLYNTSGGDGTSVVHQFMAGYTSTGASVSLTTTSYLNPNSSAKTAYGPNGGADIPLKADTRYYAQSGTIEGVDGDSFSLSSKLEGSASSQDMTGSIDIQTLGKSATDSVKIHFTVDQPASGHVTYTGELRDGADKSLATLEHKVDLGVFRATFEGGATRDIPVSTIDKVLDIAKQGPQDW